jgi:hypothetical protein
MALSRGVCSREWRCERLSHLAEQSVNSRALFNSLFVLHLCRIVPHAAQTVEFRKDEIFAELLRAVLF